MSWSRGSAPGRRELEGDHELGDPEQDRPGQDRQRQDQLRPREPLHAFAPWARAGRRAGRCGARSRLSDGPRGRRELELAGEQERGDDQQEPGEELGVEAAEERGLHAVVGEVEPAPVEARRAVDQEADHDHAEPGDGDRAEELPPPALEARRQARARQPIATGSITHEWASCGLAPLLDRGRRHGRDVRVVVGPDRDAAVVGELR